MEHLIRGSYFVLFLMLAAAIVLSLRFRDASSWQTSPEATRLDQRERDLASIRKYVTQGGTSTRDFLINNHPDNEQIFEEDLRRAKASTTKAFLPLSGWTAEQPTLIQMDHDIADFWTLLDRDSPKALATKQVQGYDFLHDRVLPARKAVFDSLKHLEDRNAEDRADLTARAVRSRSSDTIAMFVIMGISIVITLFFAAGNQQFRREFQLESRRKIDEVALARDSLEQLSGRLLRIQEDERRKISRELHDGIGQLLTALRMEIHQVSIAPAGGTDNANQRLLRARKLAEEAVQTVNNISLLLRPPLLDDLGLEPALGWLADQFSRRTAIVCRFRAQNLQEQLPDDLKTCVFRVIQEALNNCEKHASPTEVEILVEQSADTLSICVEDNGAGFELNAKNTPVRHAGLGILGMRERAVLLGGTFVIRSSPGMGTTLIMSLPVVKLGAAAELLKLPALSLKSA